MKKIAAIYTDPAPELVKTVKNELKSALGCDQVKIQEYSDKTIIQDFVKEGILSTNAVRRVHALFHRAFEDDNDLILVVCSSLGDVTRVAAPYYAMAGVPVVRIDQPVIEYVMDRFERIGFVFNIATTIGVTERLVKDYIGSSGRQRSVIYKFEEAYGMPEDQVRESLLRSCNKIENNVDVIVLGQASMAKYAPEFRELLKVPVYDTLSFAVREVQKQFNLR